MAKTYYSKFGPDDLKDFGAKKTIAKFAGQRGVESLDTREAWEKLGIKSISGTRFTNEDLDAHAAWYTISAERSLTRLLVSMARHDPKRGEGISRFAKTADVATNALNAAGIRGDHRTFDDLTKALEKFHSRMDKGNVKPENILAVAAATAYMQQVYEKHHSGFEKMKDYQTRAGFELSYVDTDKNPYLNFWTELGVPIERVNDIVSGRTVPDNISMEVKSNYRGGYKMFDLTKTDAFAMTGNGIASVDFSYNHLVGTALTGELYKQLGINAEPTVQYVAPNGLPIMQKTGVADYNSLSNENQTRFMEIVSTHGEKTFEQVQSRVALVAKIINDQVDNMMAKIKEEGGLSNFSQELQDYLTYSPDTQDEASKYAYVKDMLVARCAEAAQFGALASNDEAEIAFSLAKHTATTLNEDMEIPVYNADGTPKLDEDRNQVFGMSTIFKTGEGCKSMWALQCEGMTLRYNGGPVPSPIDDKQFRDIKAWIENEYGEMLEANGVDLSAVTIDSFKNCDPLTLGFGDLAHDKLKEKMKAELENRQSQENDPPVSGSSTSTTSPLYRSLTLYSQYVQEFKQVLANSGMKFVMQNPLAQTPPAQTPPAQTPPAQTPPVQDPPVQAPPAQDPPVQDPPAQDSPVEDLPPDQLTKTNAEIRAEIRQQVQANSKIYTKDGEICNGKFAMLQTEFAEVLGLPDPNVVSAQDMMALVGRIRGGENVTVKELLKDYKTEFNNFLSRQPEGATLNESLSRFSAQVLDGCSDSKGPSAAVLNYADNFVYHYHNEFLQEDVESVLAVQQNIVNPEKAEEIKNMVSEDLSNQACEAAAVAELEVLLNVNNHGLTPQEIPAVELPKIPPAAELEAIAPEAAPEA